MCTQAEKEIKRTFSMQNVNIFKHKFKNFLIGEVWKLLPKTLKEIETETICELFHLVVLFLLRL